MYIYNFIFCINFLLVLINIRVNKKKEILLVSFIILNIFLCFNYMNGIDWVQYQTNFLKILSFDRFIQTKNYFLNIPQRNSSELLFYYLMSIFKMIGFNYEMFQYLFLTIILYIIYKFLYKNLKFPLIGIFIYYIDFMMPNFFEPIFRQLLAMIFFLTAIDDIYNKKLYNYLKKIGIAYFFHSSSLLLILCYVIPLKKIKIKYIIIVFTVTCFIDKYLKIILTIFSKIFPIFQKYLVYFEIKRYALDRNINLIFFIKIILAILMAEYIQKNKKYLFFKNKEKFNLLLNFYWINELFFILKRQMIIFSRLQIYFSIFYVIFIAFFIEILIKKHGKQFGIIIFCVYSCLYYRIMYTRIQGWEKRDRMRYIPYTNYIVEIASNDNMKTDWLKVNYRKRMEFKDRIKSNWYNE